MLPSIIYILLSIKTRIETGSICHDRNGLIRVISYYPLKQGLKLVSKAKVVIPKSIFISYYPLKQGLKLINHALH